MGIQMLLETGMPVEAFSAVWARPLELLSQVVHVLVLLQLDE